MLKSPITKATFSAADAAHRAPYTKISFATQQNSKTAADTSARTLSNIILCSVGEAEGWGISIDVQFVTDMVNDINKNMKKGVKSNLRHNYENAGFQLGRITNVHLDGNNVVGDLKCYASADKSPLAPGMATWLVELVAEDPEAMMMSIVAVIAYCYQRDENGNEVKVWDYNEQGNWISPNYDMPIYCAYGSIESCDAVAEGALTEAMFSQQRHTEGSLFTQILAKVKRSLGIPGPDDVDADTSNRTQEFSNNEIEMTKEEMQEMLDAQASAIEVKFAAKTDELKAAFAVKEAELVSEKDALQLDITEKASLLAAAQAEVARLSELPADEHAGGDTNTTLEASKKGFGKHHDALKVELGLV